jgi:hypothetical protein
MLRKNCCSGGVGVHIIGARSIILTVLLSRRYEGCLVSLGWGMLVSSEVGGANDYQVKPPPPLRRAPPSLYSTGSLVGVKDIGS